MNRIESKGAAEGKHAPLPPAVAAAEHRHGARPQLQPTLLQATVDRLEQISVKQICVERPNRAWVAGLPADEGQRGGGAPREHVLSKDQSQFKSIQFNLIRF